ncbi:MAG: hypothetical protein ACRD7E_15745 [Bryobacteraceae bacterium]
MNGDGRIDVACIGSATANLKWYENTGGDTQDNTQGNTGDSVP